MGCYRLSLQHLHSASSYPPIAESDFQHLGAPVSFDEVRLALFSMGNYKAPCLDGFHPIFFKAKWEVLGPSIFAFVQQIFVVPSMIGDINHTFLTLIPKIVEPTKPYDFRPVALYNVIYKIVTKVLCNRIKPILSSIISLFQTSFIAGRNATDNATILLEVVHAIQLMAGRRRYMVIKFDLAKAYDKMEWSFICESLDLLHFPGHISDHIQASYPPSQ